MNVFAACMPCCIFTLHTSYHITFTMILTYLSNEHMISSIILFYIFCFSCVMKSITEASSVKCEIKLRNIATRF